MQARTAVLDKIHEALADGTFHVDEVKVLEEMSETLKESFEVRLTSVLQPQFDGQCAVDDVNVGMVSHNFCTLLLLEHAPHHNPTLDSSSPLPIAPPPLPLPLLPPLFLLSDQHAFSPFLLPSDQHPSSLPPVRNPERFPFPN